MAIVELAPFAQGSASSMAEVGYVSSETVDPLVTVAGGSVSDSSDATYVQLGAWYDRPNAQPHAEILTADFTTSGVPTAMGLQIRGSTPAATLANPPSGGRQLWVVFTAVADGSFLESQAYRTGNAFESLVLCAQDGPAALETYWGRPLDRTRPTDPGNWCELAPFADGGGEMEGAYEALTGTGIRVSVFIDHFSDSGGGPYTSRIPWIDVHELRLVVAGEFAAPPAPPYVRPTRVAPSLRMLQRGGSGGMSGIPRMVGDPTRRGIRQGPGSVY